MPARRVVTPVPRDRSIGLAAAQAIAFTTTDPGACTPPWTLQSNPRRCVVDTDGLGFYGDARRGFNSSRLRSGCGQVTRAQESVPNLCHEGVGFRCIKVGLPEPSRVITYCLVTLFSHGLEALEGVRDV